jgi:hypothetical protein
MNAGSEWIDHVGGEPELRIHELAEALCDALCKAVGDLTVERDASRLIINDLTVERDRLRAAGDALAVCVNQFGDTDNWTHDDGFLFHDEALAARVAWLEARRER